MINAVHLTGKVRDIQRFDKYINFIVETRDSYKSFINVSAKIGKVDYIEDIGDGVEVFVNGWLKQEKWTSKDGQNLSKIVVIASEVYTIY